MRFLKIRLNYLEQKLMYNIFKIKNKIQNTKENKAPYLGYSRIQKKIKPLYDIYSAVIILGSFFQKLGDSQNLVPAPVPAYMLEQSSNKKRIDEPFFGGWLWPTPEEEREERIRRKMEAQLERAELYAKMA